MFRSTARIISANARPALVGTLSNNTFSLMNVNSLTVRSFAADAKPAASSPADHIDLKNAEKELRERRMKEKFIMYPSTAKNPQVFLDLEIAGKPAGRVIIEVRSDAAPKAADNFRALCTGEKGNGASGVSLSYKGSKIFSWLRGYYINGGDIVSNNGTNGESIYGSTFKGEISDLSMGLGSVHLMANLGENPVTGRNVVNSRFSIMTVDLPSVMTGMGVVVGQVLSGMEVLEEVQAQSIKRDGQSLVPQVEVKIANCGQLSESDAIKAPVTKKAH